MAGLRSKIKKQKTTTIKRQELRAKSTGKGGLYHTVVDKTTIPSVEMWNPASADHIIDIIPWEVAGNMPLGDGMIPVSEAGDIDYELDLFVHRFVGSSKKQFVCPKANFGKPCPICEKKDEYGWREDKDFYDKYVAPLSPKQRVFYLIWDRKNEETEAKGVQIWDSSYHFTKKQIKPLADNPRSGGVIAYHDPDDGRHIMFKLNKKSKTSHEYTGWRLEQRDEPIPEEILDQSFSLDGVIKMHPTYKEIKEAFYDSEDNDTEDKENSTQGTGEMPEWDTSADDSKEESVPTPTRKKKLLKRKQ